MNKKISYILGIFVLVIGIGVGANTVSGNTVIDRISAVTSAPPAQTEPVTKEPTQQQANEQAKQIQIPVSNVNPLTVIQKPNAYLNKKIHITARFDKFATLGLDYKPAMRSSETYISFLIFRPDTDKNIPLSEMKLFLTRKSAEKFIDLKEGDLVHFSGTVFSSALGDAWVDVDTLAKVKTSTETKK